MTLVNGEITKQSECVLQSDPKIPAGENAWEKVAAQQTMIASEKVLAKDWGVMQLIKFENIILVDCTYLSSEIQDYLSNKHEYSCHYDHTVLQIEDDGNIFAEWLKENDYKFKSVPPKFDLIALYGT